jgi:hypothetical protein
MRGVFAGVEGVVMELPKQYMVANTLALVRECFSREVGMDHLVASNKPAAKPGLSAISAKAQ